MFWPSFEHLYCSYASGYDICPLSTFSEQYVARFVWKKFLCYSSFSQVFVKVEKTQLCLGQSNEGTKEWMLLQRKRTKNIAAMLVHNKHIFASQNSFSFIKWKWTK